MHHKNPRSRNGCRFVKMAKDWYPTLDINIHFQSSLLGMLKYEYIVYLSMYINISCICYTNTATLLKFGQQLYWIDTENKSLIIKFGPGLYKFQKPGSQLWIWFFVCITPFPCLLMKFSELTKSTNEYIAQ